MARKKQTSNQRNADVGKENKKQKCKNNQAQMDIGKKRTKADCNSRCPAIRENPHASSSEIDKENQSRETSP